MWIEAVYFTAYGKASSSDHLVCNNRNQIIDKMDLLFIQSLGPSECVAVISNIEFIDIF